jgi:lipopolysaccharide export system permease protein
MSILQKYISKEILRFFFIVLISVLSIYLLVDFFEKIDNFISSGVETSKAVAIFLYNIPFIIVHVVPICLLLAVLIALGLMNKHNEIVAIQSSGISVVYLLRPILFIGVFLTLILFGTSEIIVPMTVPKANKIWIEDVKKKQMVKTREHNIWIKGDHLITHIKHYDPVNKTLFGLSLYFFDESFHLVTRLDADKGIFDGNGWHLYDILEQTRSGDGDGFKARVLEEKIQKLALMPEDLHKVTQKPEEMSFPELYGYIQKVENEGYDATTYRVDLFAKTAFPFVCIILCLLGTGIAVRRGMKEGLPVGIAYGIGIAFLYWVFYSFCLSLGYGGLIPPLVSAWMTNFVFLCWGAYVLLKRE